MNCRVSSPHPDVQVPGSLQLDGHLQNRLHDSGSVREVAVLQPECQVRTEITERLETRTLHRTKLQQRNYAANKTKQVAWFVSNCGAR